MLLSLPDFLPEFSCWFKWPPSEQQPPRSLWIYVHSRERLTCDTLRNHVAALAPFFLHLRATNYQIRCETSHESHLLATLTPT